MTSVDPIIDLIDDPKLWRGMYNQLRKRVETVARDYGTRYDMCGILENALHDIDPGLRIHPGYVTVSVTVPYTLGEPGEDDRMSREDIRYLACDALDDWQRGNARRMLGMGTKVEVLFSEEISDRVSVADAQDPQDIEGPVF